MAFCGYWSNYRELQDDGEGRDLDYLIPRHSTRLLHIVLLPKIVLINHPHCCYKLLNHVRINYALLCIINMTCFSVCVCVCVCVRTCDAVV